MPLPDHRKKTGAVRRSSDHILERACGDVAYINGKRVVGYYNQEITKANLGARAGVEICIYYFEFRLCLCPEVTCGDSVKVNAEQFKIGKGGLTKPDMDGYVRAYLSDCNSCADTRGYRGKI